MVLGASWGALGRSWGALGRSKIDQKIDPKLDSKTGRIATEKMAQTLRLSMFQSLRGVSGNQMKSLEKAIKTAIDMISSYLSIYLSIDSLPRRPNHNLTAVSFQVSNPLRYLFR